jgi:hypothetical protein
MDRREITKSQDRELFFAWLGGSPGNLGVLTHFTIQVHRDSDYVGSRGLRILHFHDTTQLKKLFNQLAEMNDNPDFPCNYDICINVLGTSFDILGLMVSTTR